MMKQFILSFAGKIITCCLLLLSLNATAQEQETTDSVSTQESKSKLKARLHQVQQYLDTKARKKVDSNYIEVPEKPWMVVLRYNASVFDVDYSNSAGSPSAGDGVDWEICFEPSLASSIGVWAGYRGTGIAISKSLHRKKGTTFSFSTTGAKYGINLRLRAFDIDEVTMTSTVYDGDKVIDEKKEGHLYAPASIASLYLNGYYVFNGRRYSQAAAYSQSVIQRRSAGSLLVGATWYMSAFDFSDDKNSVLILLSHNIGRVKLHQGNIGVGYGYNWVPLRGLVHTWANGKTHKPLLDDINDPTLHEKVDSWEIGSEDEYSMLRLNVDLRLGIAYNWSNYFIGVQAQFNNFNYKKDQCKVNLFDAYGRVSFGVRL